jgi:hypothetical protein
MLRRSILAHSSVSRHYNLILSPQSPHFPTYAYIMKFCPVLLIRRTVALLRVGVTIDGVFNWILDLLTTYTHYSELKAITAPFLIATIHKSPQQPLNIL